MAWFSSDLFPTKFSIVVFISYIVLFINQGLLVRGSKEKGKDYAYDYTTVVLITELCKFTSAIILYWKDHRDENILQDVIKNRKAVLLYFVPAGLYCLYNNLAFVNLAEYDPTTYFLLLQFRVVLTGVVFQILFQKKLSRIQWVSLLLLTIGCILKEFHHSTSSDKQSSFGLFNFHFFLILVQVFASCFAGVYNEYLLKDNKAHIMLQNVFMYVDSIICNVIVLGFKGNLLTSLTTESLSSIAKPSVIAIIINNTCIGICVSLFLRSLNSILKTFASAMELMFTAVLSWMIFGIAIDLQTFASIVIITFAIVIYSQNPVVNVPKSDVQELHENTKKPPETEQV